MNQDQYIILIINYMINLSESIPTKVKFSQLSCQCPGNNKALIACVNQKCYLQGHCSCFGVKHVNCDYKRIDFMLRDLQKKINVTPTICKSIDEILYIYDEVIDQLSLDRAQIQEKKKYYGLRPFSTRFVKLLEEEKYQDISGDLMKNVKQQIQTKYPQQRLNTAAQLRNLWNKKKEKFTNFRKQLLQMVSIYEEPINSVICHFKDQLVKFVGKGVKEYKLLFRASQSQFKASEFHRKCDSIKNTLVLVKTNEQQIYGGYTPLTWTSPVSENFIQDKTKSTVVFSVTDDIRKDLRYTNNGITCCAENGPVFGNAALFISNRCNLNSVSFVNFPQEQNSSNYGRQNCKCQFKNFQVQQYEVFEVIWN